MSGRAAALVAAVVGITIVLAQDVAPGFALYHSWQYAVVLGIAATVVIGYVLGARKGTDGPLGTRLVVAMLGSLAIIAAGIASGLLGPDTEVVARAPGTVAPIPSAGVAAFFPIAGSDAIARGDALVTLRRRNASALTLGRNGRRYLGASVLTLVPKIAAYVEARDPKGAHLTITQPTNPAFLSPVLLFTQLVPIAGKELPADSFAVPALHRQIKAFYFAKGATTGMNAHGAGSGDALLFAVDDEAGHLLPGAIGFDPAGSMLEIGGVRLSGALGTYPALQVAAVPEPLALWAGGALFVAGIAFAYAPRRAPRGEGAVAAGAT